MLADVPAPTLTIGKWTLRIWRGEAQWRVPSGRWRAAPLRELAREYAVGDGPWPWLLEHGIRRPNTSGRSADATTTLQADRTRKMVAITLSDEERSALAELAELHGESRSAVVGRLVMAAAKRK